MFIYPINVEAFYFNELSDEIKNKVIEDKITYIIVNLDNKKYKKYKDTIDFVKKSDSPLDYREFIKKYNSKDIIKDILKENRLYDSHGNIFNIIYKDGKHLLFLTKTTFIPVKILTTESYNVYFKDNTNELPVITLATVQAPNKRIAKEFAISKFANNTKQTSYSETFIHKVE